jgi:hypothetical protein
MIAEIGCAQRVVPHITLPGVIEQGMQLASRGHRTRQRARAAGEQ